MKKYRLKLTTLSEAIPASGEAKGAYSNDVTHEHGVPYIQSKRIKGILRESALELTDAGEDIDINKIFGVSGDPGSRCIIIDDGYMEGHQDIVEVVKNSSDAYVTPENILGFYTTQYSRTAIKDGVAKKHSLFTDRVLKQKLDFYFDLEIAEQYINQLEMICQVTRSFGLNRTRGFGEIKLELMEASNDGADTATLPDFRDNDDVTIHITLKAESDLFVSQTVGSTQVSENFIPGSNILGAAAWKYLRDNTVKNPDNDKEFISLFLNGDVSWGNAYPCYEDKVFKPTPLSVLSVKDSDEVVDLAAERKDKQLKGQPAEFSCIKEGAIYCYHPKSKITYHHRRPDDKAIAHATEEEGEFFQFDNISKGQVFRSEVRGKYSELKEIYNTIKDMKHMRIGKSKTAQYGKCSLNIEISKSKYPEGEWKSGDTKWFCFDSPAIFINENGYYTTEINIDGFSVEEKYISHVNIGGFSGVWRMPKIQSTAVAAGSVVELKNEGNTINLSDFLKRPVGYRTAEGFGVLSVYNPSKLTVKKDEKTASAKCPLPTELANYINDIKTIREIKIKTNSFQLSGFSSSFLSRVRHLMKHSADNDSWEGAKEHMNKSDNTKKLLERLFVDLYAFEKFKTELKSENFDMYKLYVELALRNVELAQRTQEAGDEQ